MLLIVCVAPNPDSVFAFPWQLPSDVLQPQSHPNNVRLSPAHNCPSDMRAGFVLDWKIWDGMPPKLCNSAHTHTHTGRSRLKSSDAGEDMHVMLLHLCTVGFLLL